MPIPARASCLRQSALPLCAAALTLALCELAFAATITVTTTAQSPGAAGDCTLGEAITAANTDAAVDACSAGSGSDTIILPAGTYTYTVADNPLDPLFVHTALPAVTSDIVVQGAGASTTILERSTAAPLFRILRVSAGTLTLNDVTLRNGDVFGYGGAVYFASATLVVNDSVFTNNSSHAGGGALAGPANEGDPKSSLTVTNSLFTNNRTRNAEGGAITINGSGSITESSFESNTAPAHNGGAIFHTAGVLTITNSTFHLNSAMAAGAVFSGADSLGVPGHPHITSSTFTNNSAALEAGALWVSNGTRAGATQTGSITASRFFNNAAGTHVAFDGAGGAIVTHNTMLITGTTIAFNTADGAGAIAIRQNGQARVTITNSTISGNAARGSAGALFVDFGTFDLNNVTITNNIADSDGDGSGDGGGVVTGTALGVNDVVMQNTILAGNHDGSELTVTKSDNPDPATVGSTLTYTIGLTKLASSPDCFGEIVSEGFNLIGNSDGCAITHVMGGSIIGTGAAPVDPRLGPLQNNGGPTETHALETGSPAIDAGNNVTPGSTADACLATDQRGVARPVGARCDIGAFEGSVAASPTGPSTGFTITDNLPAGLTLVSVSSTAGTCTGTTSITCRFGPLANGATPTITIQVTPTTAGTFLNEVTARATGVVTGPTMTDPEGTVVNPASVTQADLAITKSASPGSTSPGHNITYTIGVTNNGPGTATNVVVTDVLPAGTTLVAASSGCTGTTTVTCTTPSLAPGVSVIHSIVVRVNTAGSISNTATVAANEIDPSGANNSATATTAVLEAIPLGGPWTMLILALILSCAGALVIARR